MSKSWVFMARVLGWVHVISTAVKPLSSSVTLPAYPVFTLIAVIYES